MEMALSFDSPTGRQIGKFFNRINRWESHPPCGGKDLFVLRLVAHEKSYAVARHALAPCRLRIARCFLQREPSEDRHQLMRRRSVLGGEGRSGFAQPMGRA